MIDVHQEFSDICSHHGIRDLRDDKPLPASLYLLRLDFAAELDLAHAALINLQKVILVDDNAPGRKIRPLDMLHHLRGRDIGIFHICLDALKHLGKIMGRDARRHADRNPFCTID